MDGYGVRQLVGALEEGDSSPVAGPPPPQATSSRRRKSADQSAHSLLDYSPVPPGQTFSSTGGPCSGFSLRWCPPSTYPGYGGSSDRRHGLILHFIGLRFRMKTSLLPLALIALSFAGCATLSEPDRQVLRQHRVSPQLYSKMDHQERLSLPDIMELAERRVSAPFVVHYLRSTYAVY